MLLPRRGPVQLHCLHAATSCGSCGVVPADVGLEGRDAVRQVGEQHLMAVLQGAGQQGRCGKDAFSRNVA